MAGLVVQTKMGGRGHARKSSGGLMPISTGQPSTPPCVKQTLAFATTHTIQQLLFELHIMHRQRKGTHIEVYITKNIEMISRS